MKGIQRGTTRQFPLSVEPGSSSNAHRGAGTDHARFPGALTVAFSILETITDEVIEDAANIRVIGN